jgi:hypothetical protein
MFSKLRARLRRPSPATAIALIALSVAMGGVAYASIPDSGGVFHGCYATTEGLVLGIPHTKGETRLVQPGEACRSYEQAVSWNQQGTPGTNGVSGWTRVSTRFESSGTEVFGSQPCPVGTKVLGGGSETLVGTAGNDAGTFAATKISNNSALLNDTTWNVHVVFDSPPPAGQVNKLEVEAICAIVN